MRRTAAVVVLLSMLPSVSHAGSAPQLIFQLGGVGHPSGDLNQTAMTLDYIFLGTPVIGEWLEFGVLHREPAYYEYGYGSFDGPTDLPPVLATGRLEGSASWEIPELSFGFVLGPSGSTTFYPYLKAGIGAYREVDRPRVQLFAPSANAASIQFMDPSEMRWDAGASIGFGARVGRPGTPAPTIEARLHLTRLDGDDLHQLLMVSGGLWFR